MGSTAIMQASRETRPRRRGRPILVVDDDPEVRGLLRDVLADAGFDAALAADGAEALRIIEDTRPALVLLDLAHGPQLLRVFTRRRAAREAEIVAVREVLERARWNRAEAARVLKIRDQTLLQKVSQSGLSWRPGFKRPR